MKIKNIFKIFVMSAVAVAGFSSCTDFLTIYPTDKTIGEEFWKTKDDVKGMVTGAYASMVSYGCQERAIIWGSFRSDELNKYSSYSSTALDNINAVNLLPTNGYNSWGDFYGVINRCNIVLNHAKDVMELDPEFTQGDYDETRAQMLALRSLCYFYLVRTFRDIPYTTQSYEDDDQAMIIPQTTPDSVMQFCIRDLEEAERYIMKSGGYGVRNWRNVGYFTRDAVHALLADIYLWRASMTHNQADYRKCIDYVDMVIRSKDEYFKTVNTDRVSSLADEFHLADRDQMYSTIFGEGNSHESILEWQYDGTNIANGGIRELYYEEGSKDSHRNTGVLEASQLFSSPDEHANDLQGTKVYASSNDYRFWQNVYGVSKTASEATGLQIRKFIATRDFVSGTGQSTGNDPTNLNTGESKSNSRAWENFSQNWIVYRLTDLMLMKAEALVQTAANDSDKVVLDQAFNLVQVVNKRSMAKTATDTLVATNFASKEQMELLVLAERERELCFEGKRWYDLVRYCYRHMEGVNINRKMADDTSWPALYSPMLRLVVRKYVNGGDAVSYKMKSEPYLYWPIQYSEELVNKLLKQNPVFIMEKTSTKN